MLESLTWEKIHKDLPYINYFITIIIILITVYSLILANPLVFPQHLVQKGKRERNVLFNDALNTFYLRLFGIRHMVKDHSDSRKGNLLPPHRLLLLINSNGSFICTIPQTG